jgi:predicted short-subunit dehydrogenase-like oxidoreductase (DUF2520 family)
VGVVGVVGAGRVGTALGAALTRAGYRVVGVSARSVASRGRAARMLPGVPIVEPAVLAGRCDILVLAVSDDAIGPVCAGLAAAGRFRPGRYVVHLSGAHGLTVLAPATAAGAVPMAIHPAMTFPGTDDDVDRLAGAAYAVTARPVDRSAAESLVRDVGGVPVWVADADRTLYHAGLVLGANNLVSLVAAAMEVLGAAGVAEPGQVLGPLLRASLENALRAGDQALTGPVRRADTGTIEAHLRALRDRAPHMVPAYLQFALVTARRARQAALRDARELDRVVALLDEQVAGVDERGR